MTRVLLTGFMLLGGTVGICRAAGPALTRFEFAQRHMGTRFQIILYAADKTTAARAARVAFARIADLDRIMSDYNKTSELMRLCQKAGGPPVRVSKDLFTVLARAKEVSQLSDGAFDVTVGPVVRLWRKSRRTKQLPDPKKLARARALVGYTKIKLDKRARTVRLAKKGMLLDLGGIAKGYSADAALAVLKKHGINRALVAAGGDIAVGAKPPGSKGWKVGIAPLLDPNKKPKRFLLLENAAVSTSGDAEQHVEIGGKRYSHIVDPRTGLGLTGRRSVTVVARRGIDSDSLTKVVSVLGSKRGLKIIDSLERVSALYVREGKKGEEVFKSKRFDRVPSVKGRDK
jgi:thiamine biosynthesis lipoprotein